MWRSVIAVWTTGVLGVLSTVAGCGLEAMDAGPLCAEGTEPLPEITLPGGEESPCRAVRSGELLINEVVHKPAGRDLDGDGASTGRDEVIELLSLAPEPVHLLGVQLIFDAKVRGEVTRSGCLPPRTVGLLVGSKTAPFELPAGAVRLELDKTLRLTDGGGTLALVGVANEVLDVVAVPLAKNATEGSVSREIDGVRDAKLMPHAHIPAAAGRTWSPGHCVDGGRFPTCLPAEVHAREDYLER